MSERAWFFASVGKQEGPFPEAQFRGLIAAGRVTPDTLVWSDGMSGWEKAADVPGLIYGGAGQPPALTESGPLEADFGVWSLFGRLLLAAIGTLLIIPAPWVMTWLYRWVVEHVHVPERPNLGFSGQPGDIWYVFILIALCSYAGVSRTWYVPYLLIPVEAVLAWLTIKWAIAHISSNGQPLSLSFTGDVWAYIGWYVFYLVSFITIIGWAWVQTAFIRWQCRNIAGTHRTVSFNASGWQVLWRTFVYGLTAIFIIPIPWTTRWLARWYVSQFSVGTPTAG